MRHPAALRSVLVGVILGSLTLAGCGDVGTDAADNSAYRVERRSDGAVETVRTVAGSQWEGTASLVEDLAIGDEFGETPYLFGFLSAAWAAGERIYVVDSQVPAVRVFDTGGQYLFDIGRPGQGPGEYGSPGGVAVTNDGRVLVADATGARINVYDAAGTLLEDWALSSQKSALGLTLNDDGEAYVQGWSIPQERMGMQVAGPDGLVGAFIFPPTMPFDPPVVDVGNGTSMVVPFAPRYTWAFAPAGEMVAGIGDAYRFEIHRPDGDVLAVERAAEAAPVAPAEAAFRADLANGSLRMMAPDARLSAADVPRHKPAYAALFPDRAGRVWVIRPGPGREDPQCIDADAAAAPTLLMSTPAGARFSIGEIGRAHV